MEPESLDGEEKTRKGAMNGSKGLVDGCHLYALLHLDYILYITNVCFKSIRGRNGLVISYACDIYICIGIVQI